MSRDSSVITRKGQVTIPMEIRKTLNLKEGDRVNFSVKDGEARLARAESVVARTAGAIKTDLPPLTAEELRTAAEKAIAEAAAERTER